jgi:hypothetical protein
MFKFFSKKNKSEEFEEKSFNIFDESTWCYATTKEFFWNGRPLPANTFVKNRAELEIASHIGGIITAVYSIGELKPGIIYTGKNSAITFLLEEIFNGISLETLHIDFFEYLRRAGRREPFFSASDDIKPITETYPKIYSMLKESGLLELADKSEFDILDFDTWQYASDSKHIIWNGKSVLGKDDNPITEKDAVDFFDTVFSFFERNGDTIPVDKKINSIKNILTGMDRVKSDPDYYIRQYRKQQEELDRSIPDGLFNPRDPETYKFAKYKPLIIDGVHIFSTSKDVNGKETKDESTERDFAQLLPMLLKANNRSTIWNKAAELVKSDFQKPGVKEPDQSTPGYVEKVDEVFQSISKDPAFMVTREHEQEYIDNHIQMLIDECTSHETEWTYGDYNFSEAQMELVGELSDEERTRIGEIMVKGLSGKKRSYQIKQDLFDSFGNKVDVYFFMSLHHAKIYTKHEEDLMLDFYSEYVDFESKDEIYEFFNKSNYLKKHKKLKESVIENALYLFDEAED